MRFCFDYAVGERGNDMSEKRSRRIVLLGILSLLIVGQWQGKVGGQTTPQPIPPTASPAPSIVKVPYYAPPKVMSFCGESVPLSNQETMERFDREFTIVVYNHAQVYLWLKRMQRYFPWIEKQLALNKLPEDMKYVAVAESDLLTTACSPAGAVGPWQFISSTGSRYGLDQSSGIDERHDFEKATASAFRYLQDLHGMFQNWTLAAAAYNCGEKRVQQEMERQKTTSYYSLKLPLETERYIFRILAIKEVLSHPQRYGYSLPQDAGYQAIRADLVKVHLPFSMPVISLAEAAGITYRDFKILNPALVSDTMPQGSNSLKVPEGKANVFLIRLEAVKASFVPAFKHHKVAKGETLTGIASHYGVSAQNVRDWNNLQGDTVKIGQTLKIQR
jgi:membrane-bound lytic murein transglycosylase D